MYTGNTLHFRVCDGDGFDQISVWTARVFTNVGCYSADVQTHEDDVVFAVYSRAVMINCSSYDPCFTSRFLPHFLFIDPVTHCCNTPFIWITVTDR